MSAPPAPFVVGAPRSGTTMLRLMLDAHPAVAIPHETAFYRAFLKVPFSAPDWLEQALDALTTCTVWPAFHLDANAFRESVRNAAPSGPADVLRHFYRAYAHRHGKERWGDKWPENGINIARIGELLAEARFIHIIRDGRDVATSLRETWFRPGESFEACIELWAYMVREGQRQASAVPGRYIEVRYERLVREPRAVLHELCEFIGLRYDKAMLRYHERARERHAEIGDVVREGRRYDKNEIASLMHTDRPPFVTSIGRWRTAMSPAEAAACERRAGSLLAELGYGPCGRKPDIIERDQDLRSRSP